MIFVNYYAVVRSGSDDALQHHGVLGMRWDNYNARAEKKPWKKKRG